MTTPRYKAIAAVLEARASLCVASARIGAIVTTSTPISRDVSPWPRVSITQEALDDLRKFYDVQLNALIEKLSSSVLELEAIKDEERATS